MKILNLTQHAATKAQIEADVVNLNGTAAASLKNHLTFNEIPNKQTLIDRAALIASIAAAHEYEYAMIGGAPFFMSYLENALRDMKIQPLYAFSQRESVEETLNDGTVIKKNIFKHLGFVEV